MDKNLKNLNKDFLCTPSRNFERCRNCTIRKDTMAGDLTVEEADRLDSIMVSKTYPPDKTIVSEGEEARSYYNIYDGVVRLVKYMPDGRRTIVGFLFPGDFFGLAEGGEHAYSAEAVTDVSMCTFPRPALEKLFEDIPKLERKLLKIMTDRVLKSQQRMTDLARKSPKERLATFLLALSETSIAKDDKTHFIIPMGRDDISDYLGLTIETISRSFSYFVKEDVIAIEKRNGITILDYEKLKSVADADS